MLINAFVAFKKSNSICMFLFSKSAIEERTLKSASRNMMQNVLNGAGLLFIMLALMQAGMR